MEESDDYDRLVTNEVTVLDVLSGRADTPGTGTPISIVSLGRYDGTVELVCFPFKQTEFLIEKLLSSLADFGDREAGQLREQFLQTRSAADHDHSTALPPAPHDDADVVPEQSEVRSPQPARFRSKLRTTGLRVSMWQDGDYRSHGVLGGYSLPEPRQYLLLCRCAGIRKDIIALACLDFKGALTVCVADDHPLALRKKQSNWEWFGRIPAGREFREGNDGVYGRKLTRSELKDLLDGEAP
ncbi:MAG TPA: hypothetical protein VFE58_01790 [Tepidisphaeraceae bacterium]|jgi:hypothetical protein|nr:hypothetical protein [Tepidisphaeraceae bacterium]